MGFRAPEEQRAGLQTGVCVPEANPETLPWMSSVLRTPSGARMAAVVLRGSASCTLPSAQPEQPASGASGRTCCCACLQGLVACLLVLT